MKKLKNSLIVRGDSLYCPLPLSLDTYGNCLTDCWHCWVRFMNHVWDSELKPLDLELFEKKLRNGLKNKNPKTPLAWGLAQKKTIRIGNKSDAFQEAENEYGVTRKAMDILLDMDWSFVIQTRFTANVMKSFDKLVQYPSLVTIMPVISPGLDKDWELLERGRTTPPLDRFKHLREFKRAGINVGVNGEPFIPGFHRIKDFVEALKLLKEYEIPSYNTYNLHFNAFTAKRLHAIGLDVERIWYYNQDDQWRKILKRLMALSEKYGIKLGCPDFVNTGMKWKEPANTCCGVNVPNPCRFNTHYFKRYYQLGKTPDEILRRANDHMGDMETAKKIVYGKNCNLYTLRDIIKDK